MRMKKKVYISLFQLKRVWLRDSSFGHHINRRIKDFSLPLLKR
uniref:Uncharacterized protein n=1 Tax=Arundo donax TaxID=35708 RepID=A0A0A9GUT6_ARUDO